MLHFFIRRGYSLMQGSNTTTSKPISFFLAPFSLSSNFTISSAVRKAHLISFTGIDKRLLFTFTSEKKSLLRIRNFISPPPISVTRFMSSIDKSCGAGGCCGGCSGCGGNSSGSGGCGGDDGCGRVGGNDGCGGADGNSSG
ncbi:unnamed protein product [Sphenostylis stenocarpa]|uniref:Uncharacterized protein n=1 Tax=Sphenostylis stenocarpa TaxID=92480 RepID=A0AA86STG9_9FABA|nr:unnamed protein product [Sphenostylis stenocarpa]